MGPYALRIIVRNNIAELRSSARTARAAIVARNAANKKDVDACRAASKKLEKVGQELDKAFRAPGVGNMPPDLVARFLEQTDAIRTRY